MNPQITQDDVIYFIMTDRFFGKNKQSVSPADNAIHGGTLDGILEKLDYLLTLGITAIWITPVYRNIEKSGNAEPYHYYWAEDFATIDLHLLDGTQLPESSDKSTLATFINRCEAKNIKVILDMVVNHVGYGAQVHFDPTWFNHGSGDIKGELSGLPDFNHDNPEVLDYFVGNIQDWITEGSVRNIRMDTVKHVEPKFWHFFKSQLKGQYPDINLLGEVLSEGKNDVEELSRYQNFHDFDSIFDFPLCTAIRSTFIYDGSIKDWLARPRLNDNEPLGILDNDNPFKGGYRNANALVTLLDNHDLQQRIMSHARSKHSGEGAALQWAIKVNKLCLGALFTVRGIPQLYYGTELGMEGWKSESEGDKDMRRDFPWELIGPDNKPLTSSTKETEIYTWTKDLIRLRKLNPAFRYGTTITLWSDDLVYAFLRVALDDVALVIINNGYEDMNFPIELQLNPQVIPIRVITAVQALVHWKTGSPLKVINNKALIKVAGKTIEIFC